MPIDDCRTCPQCRQDDEVRHVTTRWLVMTFECLRCDREWSVKIGPEPRPFFGSAPVEDVA